MALLPLQLTYSTHTATDSFGLVTTYLDIHVDNPNSDQYASMVLSYDLQVTVIVPSGTVTLYTGTDLTAPDISVDVSDYTAANELTIHLSESISAPNNTETLTQSVINVTESVQALRMRPISVWGTSDLTTGYVFLKAFCNFSNFDSLETYGVWETSVDGKYWEPLTLDGNSYTGVTATELSPQYTSSGDIAEPDPTQTQSTTFYALDVSNPMDVVSTRYDCMRVLVSDIKDCQIRFRMVTLKNVDTAPEVEFTLGTTLIIPIWEHTTELVASDLPSAASGKLLLHNRTLYTYGSASEFPTIFASNTGEFVSPLSKVIDLEGPAADVVTCVIPWRSYLVAASEHATDLITKSSSGFYTKIINSSIGIPESDSRCAVTILNGILFKSGNRIFQLYPNIYSGDDTVLNISDISKPIASEIFSSDDAFAFSTETAYYLFLPRKADTVCLKYDYTLRVWTKFTYPVHLTDYKVFSVDDIRVFGTYNGNYSEFQIESSLEKHKTEAPEDTRENLLYGDYVVTPLSEISSIGIGAQAVAPIPYLLDTGQKIDKISYTKQFTEAKFVFNTLSDKDRFPCTIQIHVDGDPRVHTINVNTDSSFWAPAARFQSTDSTDDEVLTLNVNSYTSEAELLNTFRQLIVRYSGKGKSIRFILTGTSVYPFKVNSILSRYRTLNVKQ